MRHASSILKLLLFFSIGIFLAWLALRNITPEQKQQTFNSLHQANYYWMILSLTILLISHWLRAVRWKMLLEPLDFHPKTYNTFFAVLVGYLVNLAVPRLGEVSRCGVLAKYEKVPLDKAVGTVIAERAVDMIFLTLAFLLTFLLEFKTIYGFANEKIFTPLKNKIFFLVNDPLKIIILLFVAVALIGTSVLLWKKLQGTIVSKFKNMLLGFWNGLKSIKDIKSPGKFIFYSFAIWFMYYAGLQMSFFAFEETAHLGAGEALSVLTFGTLGIIFVPAGGIGAYQRLVQESLKVFGVPEAGATAFAWAVWAVSSIISVLVFGFAALLLLAVLNRDQEVRNKIGQ